MFLMKMTFLSIPLTNSVTYIMTKYLLFISIFAFLSACGGEGGGGGAPKPSSQNSSSNVSSSVSSSASISLISSSAVSVVNSSIAMSSSVSSVISSDIQILSTDGADEAQVVMDAQGNAIAIWLKLNEGTFAYSLWFSRFNGTSWSEAALLESDAGSVNGNSNGPKIAIDPTTGKAAVIWTQFTSTSAYDVWAKTYDPTTGWAAETKIETDEAATGKVEVGIDSSGNALAVWSQLDAPFGRFSIWANRYTLASGWSTAAKIEENDGVGTLDGDPKIHMFTSGEALVVWLRSGGNDRAIWANRYSGTAWGTAQMLVLDAGTSQSFDFPVVTGDATGSALLFWGQWDFIASKSQSTLFYKPYQGAWQSTATPISPPVESALISRPIINSNASGQTVAVWGREDNSVQASVRTISTWTSATPLKPANSLEVLALPATAVDGVGNVIVAWAQRSADRTSQDLWMNRYTNGTWGSSVLAENLAGPADKPSVAASLNGRSVLVWTHTEDGKGSRIYARYFFPL